MPSTGTAPGRDARPSVPDLALAVIVVGGAGAMTGIYLDTAWHRTLGRDAFFILPHNLVYGGGAAIFCAAIGAIAWANVRDATAFGGRMLAWGALRVPFGFLVTMIGVLTVAGAAPVDALWHWMFGKDVLIWSPPHLLLALGGDITALGVLATVAGQRGRGLLARPWLWRLAMVIVFVDLIHRTHYVLAHYTMIPTTRTPDFYPFLAALGFPFILVAAERAVGCFAGTLAAALFVAVASAMDLMLRFIDFERYTISPIVAVPAIALSTTIALPALRRAPLVAGALGGAAFAAAFTIVETAWMVAVVGRPWPWPRVVAGLPWSLAAGAASGWIGAVLGGFVLTARDACGGDVFGDRVRGRRLAAGALALTVVGLLSTYTPQRYGPPMTLDEFRLGPANAIKPQEAVFWEALLQDDWTTASTLSIRSEGVIDGIPLPVGPAWCAETRTMLEADLARLRFGLEINGRAVDLDAYPVVRVRDRSGRHCAWVGVVSTFQRASDNRFVYRFEPTSTGPAPKTVEIRVVFKDP